MRSTLVFLLALLAGAAAGGLTALAGEGTPRSLLAGLAAAGVAVPFFNRLIDDSAASRPPVPTSTRVEDAEEEHRG
jgi:flavin-dependent dehydrogenase